MPELVDRTDSEPELSLGGALGATLRRDPVARLVSLGLAASIFLFLSPALAWKTYAPIVMLGLVAVSLRWGVRRLASTQERRFWNELALAYGCWLAADLLQPFFPDAGMASAVDYSRKILFASFYVFFVLAVERQPHREERLITGLERMLTWPAVTVFVLGLSIYFVMVPLIVGSQPAAAATDLLFYLCLDGALTARLVYLARTARSSRWRALYGLLALGSASLFASDLLENLDDVFPAWRLSLIFETLWCAYFVMVALAARLRHVPYPVEREASAPAAGVEKHFSGLSAKTMAAALAFPLIHFPVYALDLLEETNRSHREALVFLWMVLLGTIALVQHRLLERKAQTLWLDRVQFEEALQRSEQDLRLIIERKKADEALRASEEKFAKVFHAIPDVMLISRLVDGRFIEVNLADQQVIGYRKEEILGRTSTELNLWSDPKDRIKMIKTLQDEGTVQNIEVEVRAKSGEKRVALFSAEGIELDGMPCILSVLRDITDRTRAEKKIRERAALLDHARDAISVLDLEDRITYWNRSAERLFGWSAEEILGHSAAGRLFRTESTQPREARRKVVERGVWIGELDHITKSGEEIVVESWWTLVRDNTGQPRATLVIHGDIAGRPQT